MIGDLHATTTAFLVGILVLLVIASAIGAFLAWRCRSSPKAPTVANLNQRILAWWFMAASVVLAGVLGDGVSCVLFGFISFLALREFCTLAPTRRGDHRTMFWLFFVLVPAQFALVWQGWYGLWSILIPVWVFVFIAVRSIGSGDTRDYLARVARLQMATILCVYFVSHVPMLLRLPLTPWDGTNLNLLLYLIVIVQLSDVFQYVWGKLCGRHPVAPTVSPGKTWEGLIGGGLTAVVLAGGLWWMTPFLWWQSALFGLLIVFCGFFGGLVMSAIKRDAGIKDWGSALVGHGGILDRIDSLIFAAPPFFHLVRYWYAS